MSKKFYEKLESGEFVQVSAVSQEYVETLLQQRLARQAEVLAEKYADYDDLKKKAEQVETVKSEYETKLSEIQTQLNERETKLADLELSVSRQKVLREFNLSPELSDFVIGSNEEELRAKAEKLAHTVSTQSSVKIDREEKADVEITESQRMARELFGKSND